jgi:3-oxoacyl-[acyl-carrier protein] reductase
LGDAIEGLQSEIIGGTAKGNENMTTWCDQVALVTGGARGIGRATARLLAQRGAAVCVNYVAHADAAEGLAAEIMAAGGRAIAAMANVAEATTVEMMVARAEKELGPVTILVNNAGISWWGTLDTFDPEQVMRMRGVNVEGLIHATRAVIGGMRARRYGRIVNKLGRRDRHRPPWKRVLCGEQG